jgi:hypothetical protein
MSEALGSIPNIAKKRIIKSFRHSWFLRCLIMKLFLWAQNSSLDQEVFTLSREWEMYPPTLSQESALVSPEVTLEAAQQPSHCHLFPKRSKGTPIRPAVNYVGGEDSGLRWVEEHNSLTLVAEHHIIFPIICSFFNSCPLLPCRTCDLRCLLREEYTSLPH